MEGSSDNEHSSEAVQKLETSLFDENKTSSQGAEVSHKTLNFSALNNLTNFFLYILAIPKPFLDYFIIAMSIASF